MGSGALLMSDIRSWWTTEAEASDGAADDESCESWIAARDDAALI
jgi:hypothetical protein